MIFQLGAIKAPDNSLITEYKGQARLVSFLSQIITLLYTISGLFFLINFIVAGYQYLGSGGDPQKITNAGNKILHSLYGLIFVAGSFIIAAVLGYLLFKDASAIIKPTFFVVQ